MNYSLRPAKNIERKMMAEAFARLAPLQPLSQYRYVGFGSEFFNDFILFHESLGLQEMISFERDGARLARCQFNKPFKCIEVRSGTAATLLPTIGWKERSIVWLDYVEKLSRSVLDDVRLLASTATSGSMLVWSVNAHPWGDDEDGGAVKPSELPALRIARLKASIAPRLVPSEWIAEPLAKWGLARVYYLLLVAEVSRALSDRNAAAAAPDKLSFKQCFHFQYADGQKMLTVGGVIVNEADSTLLGEHPFAGLAFVREGADPMLLRPPVLTSREVRHLSKLISSSGAISRFPAWIDSDDINEYRKLYRYYPIYSESEL